MTKKKLFLGMLAIALVFGVVITGCGGGGGSSSKSSSSTGTGGTFTGKDLAGNEYTLLTGDAARAVKKGDNYKLKIKRAGEPEVVIEGKIEDIQGNTYTLENESDVTVTVNGNTISSIVGEITLPDGTVFIVRTFETIYMRAIRWKNDNEGIYGENWNSLDSIKLADIYNGNVSDLISEVWGDEWNKLLVSGNVDKRLQWATMDIFHVANDTSLPDDERYTWLAGGKSEKFADIPSGNFSKVEIELQRDGRIDIDELMDSKPGEIHIQFLNVLSLLLQDGSTHDGTTHDSGEKIPANIPDGAIMATVKNFTIEPYIE